MKIDTIFVHNSGGIGQDANAKSSHLSLKHIDNAHKGRWPGFKSDLGYWVGYHMVIMPNGGIYQTRRLGTEGAHTKGHNITSIGICLMGNFNVEEPTEAQVKSLQDVLFNLTTGKISQYAHVGNTEYDFSPYRVYPHRHVSNTDCYGTKLSDTWIKDIQIERISYVLSLLYKLLDLLKRKNLGGDDGRECNGFIN